jgi:hypothetical protein
LERGAFASSKGHRQTTNTHTHNCRAPDAVSLLSLPTPPFVISFAFFFPVLSFEEHIHCRMWIPYTTAYTHTHTHSEKARELKERITRKQNNGRSRFICPLFYLIDFLLHFAVFSFSLPTLCLNSVGALSSSHHHRPDCCVHRPTEKQNKKQRQFNDITL